MEIKKYESFLMKAENVREDGEQEIISVDDIQNGIYFMSNGEELTAEQLLNLYDKADTGWGVFNTDRITVTETVTDADGNVIGSQSIVDTQPIPPTHNMDIVETPTQIGGFNFGQNPYDSHQPTQMAIQQAYEPFKGDILYESFKKLNTKENIFNLGEVPLLLPDGNQIYTFMKLFSVDDDKVEDYIHGLLNDPATIEVLKAQVAKSILKSLQY